MGVRHFCGQDCLLAGSAGIAAEPSAQRSRPHRGAVAETALPVEQGTGVHAPRPGIGSEPGQQDPHPPAVTPVRVRLVSGAEHLGQAVLADLPVQVQHVHNGQGHGRIVGPVPRRL